MNSSIQNRTVEADKVSMLELSQFDCVGRILGSDKTADSAVLNEWEKQCFSEHLQMIFMLTSTWTCNMTTTACPVLRKIYRPTYAINKAQIRASLKEKRKTNAQDELSSPSPITPFFSVLYSQTLGRSLSDLTCYLTPPSWARAPILSLLTREITVFTQKPF